MADSRLCFLVDYDDPQAGVVRRYQLCYFTHDDTIEMHDVKNRRIFLKRCHYPQITPDDLFIGASVSVYSRRLRVAAYGDDATKQLFYYKAASVLLVITPDGQRSVGRILREVCGAGLRVKRMNMLTLTEAEQAELLGIEASAGPWSGGAVTAVEASGDRARERWPGVCDAAGLSGLVWCAPTDEASQLVAEWLLSNPQRKARSSACLTGCSLCIVKPHAVREGNGGEILAAIDAAGLDVTALRLVHLSRADAEDFFEVYKGVVSDYARAVDEISASPSWVAEVRGEDAVDALRELCGPYDPEIAKVLRPKSLRGRFGDTVARNAVHCSDLPEDGVAECDYFFDLMQPLA